MIPEESTLEHPFWDVARHTLFWQGRAIKHFKREAPNQEAILQQFQASDWPSCISITLPSAPGVGGKERLHDAIKHLNRSVRPYLRFSQEGSGSRVCWTPGP